MDDGHKSIKLIEAIKQHPKVVKWTGGGGAFFLINKFGFLDEDNFNLIIKWLSKLKSLIMNDITMYVIALITLCIFICIYNRIHHDGKLKENFEKDAIDTIKNNPTITNIILKGRKGNPKLSISIEKGKEENIQSENK